MAYDAKTVKVSKEVKRAAATILDPHKRGAFIRSFVKILEDNARGRSNRSKKDAKGN